MIVIACVDDNNGMMFNHRRQSQDRFLVEDMIHSSKGKKLYMKEYSYTMFRSFNPENCIVDNDFLNQAGQGDYCFVEDMSLAEYEQQIEKLIIYKWNKRYPADFSLDICMDDGWNLVDSKEFKGYSHEKITKEIYEK